MRFFFFFSSRRRHTRLQGDWSSDVCSSDLQPPSQGAEKSLRIAQSFRDAGEITVEEFRVGQALREHGLAHPPGAGEPDNRGPAPGGGDFLRPKMPFYHRNQTLHIDVYM